MPSFERQFYLENPGRWQAFKRDLRLLRLLAKYAVLWLTAGVRVRRAYRDAQTSGRPLVLEDVIGD